MQGMLLRLENSLTTPSFTLTAELTLRQTGRRVLLLDTVWRRPSTTGLETKMRQNCLNLSERRSNQDRSLECSCSQCLALSLLNKVECQIGRLFIASFTTSYFLLLSEVGLRWQFFVD